MALQRFSALSLGFVLFVAACAPAVGPDQARGPGASAGERARKTITFAVPDEPGPLISTLGGGSRRVAEDLANAVHQHLSTYDERGQIHPMLAANLPAPNDGSWTVRPDGTMQTTYKLRPNVTWHDGRSLTARDVVFAWTVTKDPEAGMSDRVVADLISRIETPDDLTLVVEWSKAYPFANAIVEEDLGPFPVHILETLYQADKEKFRVSQYWTTEFIGLGPYRVAEWELGSHLTLQAYDGFYGGRARIDTITVKFILDEAAVVANMLAGAVDGANPNALTFNQALFIKREWERAGLQPLGVVQSTHWRIMSVQFRVPGPREITDVRVRRGLMHALDRAGMVDVIFEGQAPVADSFIPPSDFKWDWVKDVVTRYDYDPNRALQVLGDAGWRRGSDGTLVDASGRKLVLPAWTSSRRTEDELALIANSWKAIGVEVEQKILTSGENADRQFSAAFPGFFTDQASIIFRNLMNKASTGTCPSEQTRWIGGNQGCYSNPAMDRAVDALTVATAPDDQRRLYRDIAKIHSEELPVLPLYFLVRMTLFRDGVTGVKGDTIPRTGVMWNVTEWDVR